MVKANELRIGNWVYWSGGEPALIEKASDLEDGYMKSYSPIPLTPELLEAAGFKKGRCHDSCGNYGEYRKDGFIIGQHQGVFFHVYWVTPLQYVHQLQNLFHSLTGEELQIKLPTPSQCPLSKEK